MSQQDHGQDQSKIKKGKQNQTKQKTSLKLKSGLVYYNFYEALERMMVDIPLPIGASGSFSLCQVVDGSTKFILKTRTS